MFHMFNIYVTYDLPLAQPPYQVNYRVPGLALAASVLGVLLLHPGADFVSISRER